MLLEREDNIVLTFMIGSTTQIREVQICRGPVGLLTEKSSEPDGKSGSPGLPGSWAFYTLPFVVKADVFAGGFYVFLCLFNGYRLVETI